jgi:hypothetical protein
MSTADKPDALPKRARNQCTKSSAQPEAARPVSTTEKRDTRFKPGNPGRPEGALNRSTMAALAIMEANAQKISEKAVELALAGDSVALRLVMERLVSPVRERPVNLALPKIQAAGDLIAEAGALRGPESTRSGRTASGFH